jgi:hypothetical protein
MSEPVLGDKHRDFPGRRLLLSLLRVSHMIGLAGLAAALLGNTGQSHDWGFLMVASGLSIALLDRWSDAGYFHQVKGLVALVKMFLVLVLVLYEPLRLPLFWFLIAFSVALSHAPGSVRHRRVF